MQNVEGCAGVAGTEPHAWETGLMDIIAYVGLDVHKATVSVALAEAGRGGEIRQLGVFENRPALLTKLAARLSKGGRRLSFCYEAGPCGYGLHRLLTGCGHDCVVVAPSLIPVKAGDRVKTDRRDAMTLAKLHRAGELTPIWIPDAAHEAMRDLVRARATAGRVLSKARQHLQGFLLRHGQIYQGVRAWTLAHRRWLTTVRFAHPAQQIVLQDYIHAVQADHSANIGSSALSQTDGAGQRSSLARMASADWVQRNGRGLALCSARSALRAACRSAIERKTRGGCAVASSWRRSSRPR